MPTVPHPPAAGNAATRRARPPAYPVSTPGPELDAQLARYELLRGSRLNKALARVLAAAGELLDAIDDFDTKYNPEGHTLRALELAGLTPPDWPESHEGPLDSLCAAAQDAAGYRHVLQILVDRIEAAVIPTAPSSDPGRKPR